MKKLLTAILCLAMVCFLAQAAGAQVKAGLRFYGGLNYLGGADLNNGGQAWFDFYKLSATSSGYSSQGTFSPAHLGLNFGGEIMILFTPQIGLGLGADYLSATRTSKIEYTKIFNPTLEQSINPKATAIPIKLTFYYFLPAAPWMNVVLQAGAGYYLAKAYYHQRVHDPTSYEDIEIDTKGNGLGFHGGLGFEFPFASQLGFLVEFLGRYASFSGFDGKITISTTGSSTTDNGKLYFIKIYSWPLSYSLLLVTPVKPTGTGITAEEAKVDFSGFSLRAGFFIRF
ncbi:MAG: outer membrane beta-barrel protein [Candidatus Aminicenantales bacterium]